MKHNNYRFLLFLAALTIIFCPSDYAFAGQDMPKRIQRQRKRFIDNQIIREDRYFLNHLSPVFDDFARINNETLFLFSTIFPDTEKSYSRITSVLEKTAKKSIYYTLKGNRPVRSVKRFINKFFPKNVNLEASLKNLFVHYRKSSRISHYIANDFSRDSLATGTYYYYNVCARSFEEKFGKSVPETLAYTGAAYKALAEASKNPNIEQLKKILIQIDDISYFEKAKQLIQYEIIDKIQFSNRNWGYNLIIRMLTMVQDQFELNKLFSKAVADKIAAIPTPLEPKLPDLQVTSIKIIMPRNAKRCRKATIVVEIKNTGQLTVGPSRAKIFFPNGSGKEKSIPKLAGGKICRIKYRYKVCRAGKNAFTVIANYGQRAWESNTHNNIRKKILTISRY